ncbi:unnamed protein product [Effrenium voratum]|nr:unnamed protein product [Effrenium voratum]
MPSKKEGSTFSGSPIEQSLQNQGSAIWSRMSRLVELKLCLPEVPRRCLTNSKYGSTLQDHRRRVLRSYFVELPYSSLVIKPQERKTSQLIFAKNTASWPVFFCF